MVAFLMVVLIGSVFCVRAAEVRRSAQKVGNGMTIVQASSNGWRGMSAGRALRTQVAVAIGSSATLAVGGDAAVVAPAQPVLEAAPASGQPSPTQASQASV